MFLCSCGCHKDTETLIKALEFLTSEMRLSNELVVKLSKEITKMATSQADFDVALATLQATLTDGLAKISTALTDLINKIQAGTTVDLTNELTAVNQMTSNLQAAVATAVADDPGVVTPVTPPPATT